MTPSEVRSLTRRYHLLLALRFVPTGLTVTVFVLLLTERGLSLGEIGLGMAAQGLVMLLLELPTGGLADALGRRLVAAAGTVISMVALSLLLVADTVWLLALMCALQGVFRALDSGPLQAWFVDGLVAADGDLERGLGRSEAMICASLAAGSLISAGLVRTNGVLWFSSLETPLVVAIVVQAVGLVATLRLVDEARSAAGWRALRAAVRDVPGVVRGGVRVVRGSSLLTALVVAEGLWGMGAVGFETLMPPRLSDLTGGADQAAALLAPVVTVAWAMSALGSAAGPALARRFGSAWAGATLRVAHGLMVLIMGLAAGAAGLVVGFLASYWVHGATNTVHYSMVHRAVSAEHRATVVSANSLAAQMGGAMSGIALGALADRSGIPTAMFVTAALLAAAAPLYLVGRRCPPADIGSDVGELITTAP